MFPARVHLVASCIKLDECAHIYSVSIQSRDVVCKAVCPHFMAWFVGIRFQKATCECCAILPTVFFFFSVRRGALYEVFSQRDFMVRNRKH